MKADERQPFLDAARASLATRPDHALELAGRLLTAAPDDIDALEIAAMAAAQLGRVDDAARGFRRIIALDPTARWASDDLARLLIGADRRAEAEAVLRQALARDGNHADAHALFGVLLAEREALVEAGVHFQRAIALAGRHPDLLVNWGRTLLRRGELEQAGELGAEAARAAPRLLSAAILAADAAEKRGDHAEAARWLDRAAPLAAAEGRDVNLARATLLSGGGQWRDGLAMLDSYAALSGAARLLRGRLRERAGRFDEAWGDFVAGKAALARPCDRAGTEALFATLATAFPPDLPPAPPRTDVPQPIFILGAPRSGTTMTEQVLAAHSRIRAGGELPFVGEMIGLAETLLGPGFPANAAELRAADRQHVPALLRDLYLSRAETYGLTAPGAGFFTDKMPLNEAWLPLIRLAFPRAPLVLLRRHPLDIMVSAMSHDLTHGHNAFYAPGDAAHALAVTGGLLRHYRAQGIEPYRFGYERFVADQAGETARLMAYLGLAAEPAQAHFHTLARHAPTPSYAQVREPLHDRSIGRWKGYARHLAPFVPALSALMAEDGYET